MFDPRKINAIIDFILDPCDAPMSLYIRTALPAALRALFFYFYDDSLKNIVAGYFRPARLLLGRRQRPGQYGTQPRSRRKRSGGQKLVDNRRRPRPKGPMPSFWSKLAQWDMANEMGKNLTGASVARGRHLSFDLVHLWWIEGVIERVLFWLFIMSLVQDFLFDWFSTIMASGYCQAAGDSSLLVQRNELFTVGLFGWVGTPMQLILKARGKVAWLGAGGGLFEPGVITFSGTIENHNDFEITAGLRLTRFLFPVATTEVQVAANGRAAVVVSVDVNAAGGVTLGCEDRISAGAGTWTDMRFTALGRNRAGLVPPRGKGVHP